jgi:hypothetical protein
MTKELIFRSMFDGKEIQLEVTDYFARHYRMSAGKCWSALCFNAATYIHFSRTGKADRAYCEDTAIAKFLKDGWRYGGSWFEFLNGRMKEIKQN